VQAGQILRHLCILDPFLCHFTNSVQAAVTQLVQQLWCATAPAIEQCDQLRQIPHMTIHPYARQPNSTYCIIYIRHAVRAWCTGSCSMHLAQLSKPATCPRDSPETCLVPSFSQQEKDESFCADFLGPRGFNDPHAGLPSVEFRHDADEPSTAMQASSSFESYATGSRSDARWSRSRVHLL
jgi:hypothetical protein